MTFGVRSWGSGPGIEATLEAQERIILGRVDQPEHNAKTKRVTMVSTAVDAGNTGSTTTLRAGLPLGKVTSTGKYIQWDNDGDATDGSAHAEGVLLKEQDMLSTAGVAEDKSGVLMLTQGHLLANYILLDNPALRNQLQNFTFDDDLARLRQQGPSVGMRTILDSSTATTIAANETGIFYILSNASAVIMTLPALVDGGGQEFIFYRYGDEAMTITSTTAHMVGENSVTSTSIVATTASEHIGACFWIRSVDVAGTSKWLAMNLSATSVHTIVMA